MIDLCLRLRPWRLIGLAALALAGCTGSDVMIGHHDSGTPGIDGGMSGEDGGTREDGGTTMDSGPSTDGGGGEMCGAVTCPAGEVCCNASCGICTPPGGSCIEIACSDAGPPGEECGPVTCGPGTVCCNASCGICAPPGFACPAIACVDAGPPGAMCGGFIGTPCPPDQFCDFPPDAYCGRADGSGVCRDVPGACTREYVPVCGCDGITYGNECTAHAEGVSVERRGACEDPPPPIDCAPQDARGEGACDLFLGYYWNGSDCRGESGCSCVGADCGSGWFDIDECYRAHAGCPPPPPPIDCSGVPCGARELCDYPDDACGTAAAGMCVPRPDFCIDIFDPVCGCDGRTYGNSCDAQSNGVDVDYRGECTTMPPVDCRVTGCGADEECQLCWASWACIPRGAVC